MKRGKSVLSFISQGMAIKQIATLLKIPISTARAIFKKFKATVTNLPGRGPMFILLPHTAGRMTREAKNSPKITVGELQREVASWGQVSKTTIRPHLHANKLFGRHARKKPFLSLHHKYKRLELLTGTVFSRQMKLKFTFSATNTQSEFCVKSRLHIPKITCKFFDVVWLFFLQRPWEPCWCTWHHSFNIQLHEMPANFKFYSWAKKMGQT